MGWVSLSFVFLLWQQPDPGNRDFNQGAFLDTTKQRPIPRHASRVLQVHRKSRVAVDRLQCFGVVVESMRLWVTPSMSAGTKSDTYGSTKCEACGVGLYQPDTAQTLCASCPALRTTMLLGGSSISDCVCEEGHIEKDSCLMKVKYVVVAYAIFHFVSRGSVEPCKDGTCEVCSEGLHCPTGQPNVQKGMPVLYCVFVCILNCGCKSVEPYVIASNASSAWLESPGRQSFPFADTP